MIIRLPQILVSCLLAVIATAAPAAAQAQHPQQNAVFVAADSNAIAPWAKADYRPGEVCAYNRRLYKGAIRKWVACRSTQRSS